LDHGFTDASDQTKAVFNRQWTLIRISEATMSTTLALMGLLPEVREHILANLNHSAVRHMGLRMLGSFSAKSSSELRNGSIGAFMGVSVLEIHFSRAAGGVQVAVGTLPRVASSMWLRRDCIEKWAGWLRKSWQLHGKYPRRAAKFCAVEAPCPRALPMRHSRAPMSRLRGRDISARHRGIAAGRDSGCPPAHYRWLWGMGAKYLPTIKDLKASQRFLQKQKPLRKFKKSSGAQTARKSGR